MSMTAQDPTARPDAAVAERQWKQLREQIYRVQSPRRLRDRGEMLVEAFVRDIISAIRIAMRLSRRMFRRLYSCLAILRLLLLRSST